MQIPLDPDWINRFLGTEISREDMVKTLEALEIHVDGDVCISPSFRIDLERPADIAEEVARIYGYNNIPSTVIRGVAEAQLTPQQQFLRKAEQTMVGLGYYGTLTYSFTSPKCFDRIGLPADGRAASDDHHYQPAGRRYQHHADNYTALHAGRTGNQL